MWSAAGWLLIGQSYGVVCDDPSEPVSHYSEHYLQVRSTQSSITGECLKLQSLGAVSVTFTRGSVSYIHQGQCPLVTRNSIGYSYQGQCRLLSPGAVSVTVTRSSVGYMLTISIY